MLKHIWMALVLHEYAVDKGHWVMKEWYTNHAWYIYQMLLENSDFYFLVAVYEY